MSQHTERKEPTFGQPSKTISSEIEVAAEKTTVKQPTNFSVHSDQSPGHTFTSPIKPKPLHFQASDMQIESTTSQPTANTTKTSPNVGFAFTPVEKEEPKQAQPQAVKPLVAEPVIPTKSTENKETQKEPEIEKSNTERVIPVANTQAESEKTAAPKKFSAKYRRLLLVALLALALILVFFLLKPKTPETVEELQSQGSTLPIEFRPVDEEEAKRAEEEALALQQQLEAERQAQQNTENAPASEVDSNESTSVEPVSSATAVEMAQQNSTSSNTENTQTAPVLKPATAVQHSTNANKVETVRKPTTSVIHQPENTQSVKTLKPVKSEPVKSNTQTVNKAKAETAKMTTPAPQKASTTASNAVATSKTITVQKGVTLFQNFRDNGLEANLPELNKMTKLNGATSRLNPGQKITVRLDKNNRIVEMNIGTGRYIRQADGSYIYR